MAVLAERSIAMVAAMVTKIRAGNGMIGSPCGKSKWDDAPSVGEIYEKILKPGHREIHTGVSYTENVRRRLMNQWSDIAKLTFCNLEVRRRQITDQTSGPINRMRAVSAACPLPF
jgi:hypothetical protein